MPHDDARERWPIDAITRQPIPPRTQPGYYPGFHTLDQQPFWDEATRKVVCDRVEHTPPIRFFTRDEAALMTALCDRLIPQDDRTATHRVPIVPFIDERLFTGRIDGYRYDDMPPDDEAYRLGIQGIETIAQALYGRPFVDLGPWEQERIIASLHDESPPAAHDIWQRVPLDRFWLLLMSDVVGAYYAHPWAWDEIGFGGPAYPRGYFRLEGGKPEPWEERERRYAWEAPPLSRSDAAKPIGGTHPGRHQPPGQGGTH